MKPNINIQRQPGAPILPVSGAVEEIEVGVTLDTLIEYRFILPGIVHYLRAERRKLGYFRHKAERKQISERIAVVRYHQNDLKKAEYDKSSSIDLTAQESNVAMEQLTTDLNSPKLRQGVPEMRSKLATGIGQCISRTLLLLETTKLQPDANPWLSGLSNRDPGAMLD